jgi:chromosome segregation ATPase
MAVYQPKGSTANGAAASTSFEVRASASTDDARAELAREQERLRKLWDAFKSQEDELNQLRAQVSGTSSAAATAAAADARTAESLRREVELLSSDLRRAGEAQRALEEQQAALRESVRDHDDVVRRNATLQSELEQERERLAKLYAVYEDVEAERARLEGHLKEWEAWFNGVAPSLGEICRSIGGAPRGR